MTYVIAEPCIGVKDRACVDECPVDCIYEGEEQLYIHPEECVDCDACLPACPVDAIFPADNVPAEWTNFTASQRQVLRGEPRGLRGSDGEPLRSGRGTRGVRSQRRHARNGSSAGGWMPSHAHHAVFL